MEEYQVIAIQECSDGDSEVGDMWLETQVFSSNDRICDIFDWAKPLRGSGGKLILTIPKSKLEDKR